MDIDRRTALAATGLAGLMAAKPNALMAAGSLDHSGFGQAVEAMRAAMLSGDEAVLVSMLDNALVYMHSSGHSQTKTDVLQDLAGKAFFASLTYPESVLKVIGDTGIALLTVDQVKNIAGGRTRASRIKVLQTWVRRRKGWRMVARSSAMLVSASGARPVSSPSSSSASE